MPVSPNRLQSGRGAETAAWLAAAAIAGLDFLLPPGYAVGVLYVGVVLLALWIDRGGFLIQFGAAATALVVAGLFVPPEGGDWSPGVFNRAVSIGALWTTVVGLSWYRRAAAAREAAETQLREQEALVGLGRLGAAMAHEVRNATTGIGGSLELLGDVSGGEGWTPEVRERIAERVAALNESVAELLAFTDLRPLRRTGCSLRGLVERAASRTAALPSCAHVSIAIDVPDCRVFVDRDAIERVVQGLIVNGAQATPVAGRILVRGVVRDGRWRLEIADPGVGIPPAMRARLFEPFFSTKHRGLGLGLAYARRILLAHGGTIALDSPPGGGTIAAIEAPIGESTGGDE